MRQILLWITIAGLLCGCMPSDDDVDQALRLRQQVLQNACEFDAIITADYTDEIYTFTLHCGVDATGVMKFEVKEPESISGISGTISTTQQSLTFDNTVLAFAPMADGYITPVCAPWVVINSLRSGYINSCTKHQDGLVVSIDDSYHDDPLQVDIHLNSEAVPVFAEILWQGRRVLTLGIEDFKIL